jgi:hypothetical protein
MREGTRRGRPGRGARRRAADLLERLDPAGLDPALDADELVSSIELTTLGKDGFRRLLTALIRLGDRAPAFSLDRVAPRRFATLVGRASKIQLDVALAEPGLPVSS